MSKVKPAEPTTRTGPFGFNGQKSSNEGLEYKTKDHDLINDRKFNQEKKTLTDLEANGSYENNANKIRQEKQEKEEKATLYFKDKKSKIDYVLAYEDEEDVDKIKRREQFEKNLKEEGLLLEYEAKEDTIIKKTSFVKVHATWDVLTKYAEITNIKMPLKENDTEEEMSTIERWLAKLASPFELSKDIIQDEPNYFTAPFNRDREKQFIIEDKDTFFTFSQRSRIVYEILARTTFEISDKEEKGIGISKLISNGTYKAAFSLHDGRYKYKQSIEETGPANARHLLYETWARPGRWYKFQPLDHVRSYFGEKIGIYFAWLGFYTFMLIPAAVIGILVFIGGLASLHADTPTNEICDKDGPGNFTMCPLCDKSCTYFRLSDTCPYSRATYLFDNIGTLVFSLIMALWSTFFQELWKRKRAEIEYDWDVAGFEAEEETIRPEFEAAVTETKPNPITKKDEPFVPALSKFLRYFTTSSIIIFALCVIIGALVGVVTYRIVVAAVMAGSDDSTLRQRASIIASATAALINFVIILIFNFIYGRIAIVLTNIEQHRTQTEWEDAFTFKMFLFQCVNYYSTIVYVAFFKGRFVGRPGAYNYSLFNKRQEECDPAGCLIEVCIQLSIIMVGKQAFNNVKEIIIPKILVWFKSRKAKKEEKEKDAIYTRWEQDYNLANQPKMGLFDEYLEMVIQYGFVTIFVAAFPLAPFFALVNNIIEIRLDAYKFVTQWKRPMAARAQDIGIWFGILRAISAVAVITNAAIIAFTSELIPKLVYRNSHSSDNSLNGYINFRMSTFDVSDFQTQSIPDEVPAEFGTVTQCRFRGFYEPPGGSNEYQFTSVYWEVLAAQMTFIVVFENFVVLLTWLVMYIIPDIPHKVKIEMLREKYLSTEALFKAESIKYRPMRGGDGGNVRVTDVANRNII